MPDTFIKREFINRIVTVAVISLVTSYSSAQDSEPLPDYFSLDIEELLNTRVISVSKTDQVISDAAASIYVISQDDIRNSGATTIPEALRLAPHLQVTKITASTYAISVRGFNSAASNKLLVLRDGRTIYSPLFSGVFWDQQDFMLEDVERIEVISGPGGTLWGSNAVNGVINIVSRNTADSTGGLAAAHAGNFERGVRARYGGTLGESGHYRVYAKAREIDNSIRANGANPHDGFRNIQAGFRGDWKSGNDYFTVQGDSYQGKTEDRGAINNIVLGDIRVSGTNLLTRWQRNYDDGSDLQVQAYWDYTKRRDNVLFQPRADIFDIEMQYGTSINRHRLLWGGGYRHARDDVDPGFFSTFVPDSRTLEWGNLFIQDEFNLTDRVKAIAGIKLEHNDYTGLEYLPNIRFAWNHSEQSLLWTAFSRAIRAPSRYDKDVYFPAPPNSIVTGGPDFESEVANIIELGYRGKAWNRLMYSATAYYHDWDKLRSGTSTLPLKFENNIQANTYGIELWFAYQLLPRWRISGGGNNLTNDLRIKPGTNAVGLNDVLSADPKYQAQLRSTWEASDNTLFEISVRHVAELSHQPVPAYTALDAHYSWQFNKQLEFSITGQNLGDKHHREFGRASSMNEFERMAWVSVTWTPLTRW